MKIGKTILFAFSILLIVSCETDPIIYTPDKPFPIIYAVFDDHDTSHYILIGKTFGAQKSPSEFGCFRDSLYRDDLELEVGLHEEYSNSWIMIKPEKVTGMAKDSGFFLYPYQEYYKFDRVIIDTITIRVSIPGHEDAGNYHQ